MNIQIINYEQPEINYGEILRYLGVKDAGKDNGANLEVLKLANECLEEALPKIQYRVCYAELNTMEMLQAGFLGLDYLKNARSCVVFGATLGLEFDRLINKYQTTSVAKAAVLEAIGTERIEALCDNFNFDVSDMAEEAGYVTKDRISPGYGTFPIEAQKEMFRILDLPRKIGLTLNESLLMSPSKSVTALIGVFDWYDEDEEDLNGEGCEKTKCATCSLGTCGFRQE